MGEHGHDSEQFGVSGQWFGVSGQWSVVRGQWVKRRPDQRGKE